jgi:hypothetical protein
MSQDTLSDVLHAVRLRGAVFYYVSFTDEWSAKAVVVSEMAGAVLPGADHLKITLKPSRAVCAPCCGACSIGV